jgi:hypothetical protein
MLPGQSGMLPIDKPTHARSISLPHLSTPAMPRSAWSARSGRTPPPGPWGVPEKHMVLDTVSMTLETMIRSQLSTAVGEGDL